ncbi:hypothetical protein JCM6882_009238 [Rhodosporidiobolus microsporus]
MQHPVQALIATSEHLVTASNTALASFDAATNAPVATSTNAHKSLIRLLATVVDPATGKTLLVSTGEDKLLVVSSLPDLAVVSSRELLKRANALDVTAKGEIVVGDKFGDVYIYPLHPAPIPAGTKPADIPKPLPILGHVSMLNALALIPAAVEHGIPRDWIATGDRDEHVRFSRFPEGHVIEKYGWGSKQFVSSLLYLPAPAASSPSSSPSPPYLLSAGADPTLQVFALPSASLVAQFPIEELLFPYVAVSPQTPMPVPAGRRKDKKGVNEKKKKQAKGKGKAEAEAEVEAEEGKEATPAAEEEPAEAVAVEEVEEEEEEVEETRGGKDLTKGLAVIKMVEVGTTRENGGVVVLAAGSTALLYIPFSLLLPTVSPSTPAAVPSLLPFAHPILDFTPLPLPTSSTSACEFLVALDHTRSAAEAATTSTDEPTPFARVSLTTEGHLRALPTLTTDAVLLSTATAALPSASSSGKGKNKSANGPSGPALSVASLYPVLSLLHHPGDEEFEGGFAAPEAGEGADELVAKGVGNGKPKGGKNVNLSAVGQGKKRAALAEGEDTASAAEDGSDSAASGGRNLRFRPGKRAVGRAETLRRYEEAKLKLAEQEKEGGGGAAAQLTEGERAAVAEIEGEAGEAMAVEGAETEGAKVA